VTLANTNEIFTWNSKRSQRINWVYEHFLITINISRKRTHDKRWYTEPSLGLNAMAVTAPVCPCKTEMGIPSGKRHCIIPKRTIYLSEWMKLGTLKDEVENSYHSNDKIIGSRCH
jgi:hypothetical protein